MSDNTIKTRIVHKHAIEANWAKATNFVPKQGELIIYDDRYIDSNGQVVIVADAIRWKIGDGVTLVNNLQFVDENFKSSMTSRLEALEKIIYSIPPMTEYDGAAALDAGLIIDTGVAEYSILDLGVIV